MKTILLLLVPFPLLAQSPECDCFTELDFALTNLRKTPAYRQQKDSAIIREAKHLPLVIDKMRADSLLDISCYYYIGMAVHSIVDDGHIMVVPKNTKLKSNEIRRSKAFLKDVRFDGSEEQLRTLAARYDKGDLPGIYHRDTLEVALLPVGDSLSTYEAYLLGSHDVLDIGQRVFRLSADDFGRFSILVYTKNRYPVYLSARSVEHALDVLKFHKDSITLRASWPKFNRKNLLPFDTLLAPQTLYAWIPSFDDSHSRSVKLKSFMRRLTKKLSGSSDFILDLRNNPGGRKMWINRIARIGRRYPNLKIHVLINGKTASAAEHISIELHRAGATLYGEPTYGAFNYGLDWRIRFIKRIRYRSPCDMYLIYPNRGFSRINSDYLHYEKKGIPVDVNLSDDVDWIETVLQIISNQ